VFAEVVIPVFAHNPTVRLLPDNSLVLFFIGDGNSTGTQPLPKNCTHGAVSTTSTTATPVRRYRDTPPWQTPMDQCGGMTVARAPSVFGPWTVTPIEIANCADSKWIGYVVYGVQLQAHLRVHFQFCQYAGVVDSHVCVSVCVCVRVCVVCVSGLFAGVPSPTHRHIFCPTALWCWRFKPGTVMNPLVLVLSCWAWLGLIHTLDRTRSLRVSH